MQKLKAVQPGKEKTRVRKRDPGSTRASILSAARHVFALKGYDGAGTREIAAIAGCNVSLINRYFGTKEDLFREVMEQCIDLSALFERDISDFPSAIVDTALTKRVDPQVFDPMYAAVRSSSSEVALKIAKEQLGNPMVRELAEYLGGKDAEVRAALVLSLVAGFDIARHLIGPDALDRDNDKTLRPRLEAAVRAIIA